MSLSAIAGKVREGVPLSHADGLALYQHPNLMEVGALANDVRERLHGDRTYFNRNLHINPTNVCVASCKLCSFSRKRRADAEGATSCSAWTKRWTNCAPAWQPVTRVPRSMSWADCTTAGLRLLHRVAVDAQGGRTGRQPQGLLRGGDLLLSPPVRRMSIEDILRRLQAAGLDSLPGGGAEIFSAACARPSVRTSAARTNGWRCTASPTGWALKSNCTMLFGTVETLAERVDHLLLLRAQQAETAGFMAFIPLPFHPENNALGDRPAPTAAECLRTVAVARLLLHNVPHIKAYWVSLGLATAQTALWFGADDFDGTVSEEKIYHQAGSLSPQALASGEIARLVRAAGRVPVERDTLYGTLPQASGEAL